MAIDEMYINKKTKAGNATSNCRLKLDQLHLEQISKLCASEMLFFNNEIIKKKSLQSKQAFMVERMLITNEEATDLLNLYNKKHVPKMKTVQNLLTASLELIQAAELNKKNLVNHILMFKFYKNLLSMQLQYSELNQTVTGKNYIQNNKKAAGLQKKDKATNQQEQRLFKYVLKLFQQSQELKGEVKPEPAAEGAFGSIEQHLSKPAVIRDDISNVTSITIQQDFDKKVDHGERNAINVDEAAYYTPFMNESVVPADQTIALQAFEPISLLCVSQTTMIRDEPEP